MIAYGPKKAVNAIRRVSYYFLQVIFFAFLWSVFREEISLGTFFYGVIFGVLSIIITNKLIIKRTVKGEVRQKFPFVRFFVFVIVLLIQIYKSGFVAIGKIMRGKLNTSVIDISTEIDDDLIISFMANAITLTPGTVTIDKETRNLKILCLDPVTDNPEIAGEIIKGKYERIFKKRR